MNRSRNRKKARVPSRAIRLLNDGPSYGGQQKSTLVLQCTPVLLTAANTTGLVNTPVLINIGLITGFASRFGSTFDEYRILSARVIAYAISASNGVSKMWFDEKSTSTPTLNESMERTVLTVPNTNAAKFKNNLSWRARDLLDLEYTAIGSVVSPVTFKVYSDNANYNGPAVGPTPLWIIEIDLVMEFRGIKST